MKRRTAESAMIGAVRNFNRFYTQKLGVLDEGLLETEYSLAEVRVLFEIAHQPGCIASQIEQGLALDRGYLSRMLARLAKQRLVQRTRSRDDRRQMTLALTAKGKRVFADLDARAARQVGGFMSHLTGSDRQRLVSHLGSVRQLISGNKGGASQVTLRDPRPGDLGWVVQRHGALYAQEYGWNVEFEALVARIVGEYVQNHDAKRDRCWIAELHGAPVGSVFLVHKDDAIAKLRLLLVEPSARGHGVGRRLVEACVDFARAAGYKRIELWTNSVLVAARHLYEQFGFKRVQREPHVSFGQRLVGETWALSVADQA
jgi:DNA-binding MarR family transcriptional regulator/GNAT superfamily N-acetyltransferase